MSRENLLEALTLDDLPEQYKPLAAAVGLENVIKLSARFGGTQLYIPQNFELIKEMAYKRIEERFDGTNANELAMEYRISVSTVYRVVKEKIAQRKANPYGDAQPSLF